MRVLVDGKSLWDGNRGRGVGGYAWEVLTRVAAAPDMDVEVLVTAGTEVPPGTRPVWVTRRLGHRFADIEHERRLPGEIDASEADVFFSPALEPPLRCSKPWVQTLHDIIPLVYDHRWYRHDRRRWIRRYPRIAAADAVVCVSRQSADDAVAVLGLDRRRLTVAHNGVGPPFTTLPPGGDRGHPPYLLYVSVYAPHKGYPEAFEVISRLADQGHPHRLKVVGRLEPWWNDLEVRRVLTLCDRPERVDLLGSIDAAELVRLYQGAEVMLVTSRYEGFGLPVVEAMRCGAPVVAFANSSLREVVGDAGLQVADGDTTAMSAAVAGLLDDPAARADLGQRGAARAAGFTWDASAAIHLDVLRSLAAR